MSIDKSFSLEFTDSNGSTYATGSTLTIGGGDCFARLYLNSGTIGYATLNATAKNALYPTATAKPFKCDSHARSSRNIAGTANFELQFANTAVHSWSDSSNSYSNHDSSGLTNSVITNSTRDTQIRWKLKTTATTRAARLLNARLTLYFKQYSCSASAGTGISSATVSSSSPYQGDSVTFTASVSTGYDFDGWYNGNTRVSTNTSYTVSASDLSLTAKATPKTYTIGVSTSNGLVSVSLNDQSTIGAFSITAPYGSVVRYSCIVSDAYDFVGWYNGDTKVSSSQTYDLVVSGDLSLTGKAEIKKYTVSCGNYTGLTINIEARTTPSTAPYASGPPPITIRHGSFCKFIAQVQNGYRFDGWYSDPSLTTLVSTSLEYSVWDICSDYSLYPKTTLLTYYVQATVSGEASHLASFTTHNYTQHTYWTHGNGNGHYGDSMSVAVTTGNKPYTVDGWYINGVYAGNDDSVSFTLTEDVSITVEVYYVVYTITAVSGTGVTASASRASGNVDQSVTFTATLTDPTNYYFVGWYSDSSHTELVSSLASYTIPYITENITLYAKARRYSTGLMVKDNGSYSDIVGIYKKVNGVYVEQEDIESVKSLLTSRTIVRK